MNDFLVTYRNATIVVLYKLGTFHSVTVNMPGGTTYTCTTNPAVIGAIRIGITDVDNQPIPSGHYNYGTLQGAAIDRLREAAGENVDGRGKALLAACHFCAPWMLARGY